MLPFSDIVRIYDPHILKVMTAALDQASQSLPAGVRDSERARRRLAFLVIRTVDRGEHDPSRISDLVVTEFLSWSGSSSLSAPSPDCERQAHGRVAQGEAAPDPPAHREPHGEDRARTAQCADTDA